jgi:hypothetical protein
VRIVDSNLGPRLPGVAVKRIKPNILSELFDESRTFWNEAIGLDGGDGLDWINVTEHS